MKFGMRLSSGATWVIAGVLSTGVSVAPQTAAALAPGQSARAEAAQSAGVNARANPAEILSDTQGVDFNPYLRRILRTIYDQWLPLLPEEARPPQNVAGETVIRFAILPDGTIESMHLESNTHDDKLNKAAWGAITGVGRFPALPPAFHGAHLEMRVPFKVNE